MMFTYPDKFWIDMLGLSVFWVAPLLWLELQITALVVLRRWQWLVAALPIAGLAYIIPVTYEGWRTNSNLWPILYILFSGPAAGLEALCLVLSRRLKPRYWLGFVAFTAAAFSLMSVLSARAVWAAQKEEKRKQHEARTTPHAFIGEVESVGASSGAARAAVETLASQYRSCYTRGLATAPGSHGRFTARLAIADSGRVVAATTEQSIGAVAIEECVLQALRTVSFDSLPSGRGATVWVTIAFEPPNKN